MSRTRLQWAFGARERTPVLRAKVACVMTARSARESHVRGTGLRAPERSQRYRGDFVTILISKVMAARFAQISSKCSRAVWAAKRRKASCLCSW
jgi:hypothetical protein